LLVALFRFRKRGLWLLTGAPFALLVPCTWGLVWWGCEVRRNPNACP